MEKVAVKIQWQNKTFIFIMYNIFKLTKYIFFSNLLYILYSKCYWYRNQVFNFIWTVFLFSLYLWIACLFGLKWTAGRQYWFMVREPMWHWLSHFHWIAWAPGIKCFFSPWLSIPFLSDISYNVLTLHSSSQIHSLCWCKLRDLT